MDKYYQLCLLIRENSQVYAWLDQAIVHEGAMIEMLDLPNPRDFWTIRLEANQKII